VVRGGASLTHGISNFLSALLLLLLWYIVCVGQVSVVLKKPGTKMEHHGIKIEFIGQIGE